MLTLVVFLCFNSLKNICSYANNSCSVFLFSILFNSISVYRICNWCALNLKHTKSMYFLCIYHSQLVFISIPYHCSCSTRLVYFLSLSHNFLHFFLLHSISFTLSSLLSASHERERRKKKAFSLHYIVLFILWLFML